MLLVQLPLLHLPLGRLTRPHQLLLLLQELAVEQRNLLLVSVAEATERALVGLVQLGEKILLLEN